HAAPFEFDEALALGTSIARAACDDHGTGAQPASIGERQRQLAVPPRARAVERRRLRGNQDLGAELLRLHEGAARERLTGDSRREAEVVLDACARPRLSAICTAVE